MATHSSIFAWRIPWTEEPGELHSPWGWRVRQECLYVVLEIATLCKYNYKEKDG